MSLNRSTTPPRLIWPALAASLALSSAPTFAQNLPQSGPPNGAGASTAVPGASVTVRPGKSNYVTPDLRTAVVGATETGGDVNMARRALSAANAAISVLPGYAIVPPGEVANAMQNIKKDALRMPEYQYLGKQLKAPRALSVTLLPGEGDASYKAIAELYDTQTGGLVGRSEKAYTATEANANPARVTESTTPAANIERGTLVDGPTATLRERSVDGAVARAIFGLNDPIQVRGVVLSKPNGYRARVSFGDIQGIRTGAPIEYITPQGDVLAYGTLIDVAGGEALATVAPENAFANIYVNCLVRNTDNPPPGRAGASQRQIDDRDWRTFERRFGVAVALAAGIYYATTR